MVACHRMRAMPGARVAFARMRAAWWRDAGAASSILDRRLPPISPAIRAAWLSVFAYVLFGTYIGIGALAYDFGFSLLWVCLSTVLVWAGPAQVILISALGGGAALIEVAIAVGLSGVRLLPMVVSLLPILRTPQTRQRDLILPAHFTAVSMWVESMRIAPQIEPKHRIAFCNGIGTGYGSSALIATVIGYYLAARLPLLMTAGLLFLTPLSFLISVVRNSRDAGRPARACARPRDRPAARLSQCRSRHSVGRHRRRNARLCRASRAGEPAMNALTADLWPYLLLVLVGFLPNEIWRVLGLVAARGLDEDSEIVVWVRAVATAVLAAVIAKLTIFSPGVLASVPLAIRLAAVASGLAGYFLIRRSVFAGVIVGEIVLIVGALLSGR